VASSAPVRRTQLRVAVVGASLARTCGVRDHATLLAGALAEEGISCSIHWLQRTETSPRGTVSEMRAWTRGLSRELERSRPDAVLLHYSVFSYSYKGVPVFVPALMSAVRSTGAPVVSVLHELVYRWNYNGIRGKVWALTQRALLIEVMRTSAAVLVTAEPRVSWLQTRRWLPKRPVLLAPVFSNLPRSLAVPPAQDEQPVVGLFGYAYQGAAVALVLDALQALRREGVDARLELLGAPGSESAAGEMWLAGARERGLAQALSFSGALPAQELADALASCEVMLFADTGGPTSRKGTLAGSLASGRPVVALDGPQTWRMPVETGALRIANPTAEDVAATLAELLADRDAREALGARGRSFAESDMGLARTAEAVTRTIEKLLDGKVE
jgi:glycosyltransferase involved in cell wall biosynthesis